jgi:hypothetical protein
MVTKTFGKKAETSFLGKYNIFCDIWAKSKLFEGV